MPCAEGVSHQVRRQCRRLLEPLAAARAHDPHTRQRQHGHQLPRGEGGGGGEVLGPSAMPVHGLLALEEPGAEEQRLEQPDDVALTQRASMGDAVQLQRRHARRREQSGEPDALRLLLAIDDRLEHRTDEHGEREQEGLDPRRARLQRDRLRAVACGEPSADDEAVLCERPFEVSVVLRAAVGQGRQHDGEGDREAQQGGDRRLADPLVEQLDARVVATVGGGHKS
mmetsp:Transcript_30748/g.72625  ORF Transcript_30748/g.72625 Transcript_30748/m.72625 type:complete len:226 (+) Transcript_30748:648-1325(+)